MIEVCGSFDENKLLKALTVTGHFAESRDEEGYEICVAASVLTQGMVKAIKVNMPDVKFTYDKKSGKLTFKAISLGVTNSIEYKAVTEGFITAIHDLAKQYPKNICYTAKITGGTDGA